MLSALANEMNWESVRRSDVLNQWRMYWARDSDITTRMIVSNLECVRHRKSDAQSSGFGKIPLGSIELVIVPPWRMSAREIESLQKLSTCFIILSAFANHPVSFACLNIAYWYIVDVSVPLTRIDSLSPLYPWLNLSPHFCVILVIFDVALEVGKAGGTNEFNWVMAMHLLSFKLFWHYFWH